MPHAANSGTARKAAYSRRSSTPIFKRLLLSSRRCDLRSSRRRRRTNRDAAHLPRVEVRHEPEQTVCSCGCALKRIGEDVSEKLDYTPSVFHVERHIRGKWACLKCQTLIQAPVPAQVIDKGVPTAGLLAQVLIAKYADHQPLYRQEGIFERAGVALPRSTLA